jgi:hypothetical protein
MFNRSIVDTLPSQGLATNSSARAEIAVNAPTGVAEMPELAVSGVVGGQQIPQDHERLANETHVIAHIRAAVDGFYSSKEEIEALEKLRAKLTMGYKTIKETDLIPLDIEKDLDEVAKQHASILGAEVTGNVSQTGSGRLAEPPHTVTDKKRVLSKIKEALARIGQLKGELGETENQGYNQLLGLNALVSGLNSARTQVDDSSYSVSAASTAVDSILVNVRTAVVAHGRTSADIVRLVLTT